MTEALPWPTDLLLSPDRRSLTVSYDDGQVITLAAEYLRVESPSAEVQGHGPDQKQLVPGKAGVAIKAIEPIGNYAVRLVFDDGHDTGIYSWRYFLELHRAEANLWQAYLAALSAAGLKR